MNHNLIIKSLSLSNMWVEQYENDEFSEKKCNNCWK